MLDLDAIFDPDRPPASQHHNEVRRIRAELALLPDPADGLSPEHLPEEWMEYWQERTAIMREDGKLPLEHAEAKALADTLLAMERAGVNPKFSS